MHNISLMTVMSGKIKSHPLFIHFFMWYCGYAIPCVCVPIHLLGCICINYGYTEKDIFIIVIISICSSVNMVLRLYK
jgi:hypothetical protein